MRKTLIVAQREYLAAVRTKTFLIGLLIMPIMMGTSALLQYLLKDVVDTEDKRFALVDRVGRPDVVSFFQTALEAYNQETIDPETKQQKKPRFVVEVVPAAASEQVAQQRLELSQQVRNGRILGFLEMVPPESAAKPEAELKLRYQTNRPTYADFAVLAEKLLSEYLREQLARQAKLAPETARRLVTPVFLDQKGLATQDTSGTIDEATEQTRFGSLLVPTVLTVLMFMLILMGSTPLMQGVVEEKMQRIAEVLLGSVRPFELMMGKLIGMTGVSLTIGGVYLAGAAWAAGQFGLESLTIDLILWFILFQTLASLMFGSLFIAIGAACTEMKETQNLVLPVMLLACIPMFVMGSILREPNGPVIRGLTYFPFSTPALMMARLSILPTVPWWEPLLGAVIVLATTLLCVWIAGRIFRVGILLQGKGANLRQIMRWVIKG